MEESKPQDHRIVANGLTYRVLEWSGVSRGKEATFLLLHGFMDAAATWAPVAERLAQGGSLVLAPDLRGYGDSARVPGGAYYHFPDYVADVADVVDQLAARSPLCLVGHSMGGTIATLYAGAFPERVTRLALLEGIGPPGGTFESMPDRMRGWIEQTRALRERGRGKTIGTLEDALRRLAANHPGVPGDVLRAHVEELVVRDETGHLAWKGDPLHRPTSPMPFFAQGYVEFARRVTCPVLYVSGGTAGLHPEDEPARLAAFARLQIEELPDAGHMMHWTRPAEVAARLLAFWRT